MTGGSQFYLDQTGKNELKLTGDDREHDYRAMK